MFAEAQAASPRPWTENTREGGGEAVERSRGGGREGHRIRSLGCGRGEGRKGSPRSIRLLDSRVLHKAVKQNQAFGVRNVEELESRCCP